MADTITIANPPNNTTRSRSTTGCWTCRARRKKCDERPRKCSTCLSLRLVCDGYGPKPTWMDGGPLEKQKAEEIKIEVNKHRRRGRRKSQVSRDAMSEENGLIIQTDVDDTRNDFTNYGSEAPQTPTSSMVDGSSQDTRRDSHQSHVDGYDELSDNSAMPPGDDIYVTSPVAAGFPSDVSSPADFEQILSSATGLDSPMRFPTWEQLVGNGTSFFLTPLPEESTAFDFGSTPLPTSTSSPTYNDLIAPVLLAAATNHSVQRNDSPSLHHVMDHILPNMLPSLSQKTRTMIRNRAHQPHAGSASLVSTSILALSHFFRKLGLERISGYSDVNLDAAIREDSSQARRLLGAALQRSHGDNQDLPDLALSLLLILLLHVEQGLVDQENIANLLQSVMAQPKSPLAADNDLTRITCSLAVAHDVLWSASTRRRPLLTGDATSIANLDSMELDMSQATNCEGWVFQHIAQVTLLRIWKRECLNSQALNIAELARRATKLEQQIDSHSLRLMDNAVAADVDQPCLSVTKVYVAATKVYLHVVLSGASPEVSDISDAVEATVNALKALNNATMIRRLAWPICVAASLADSRHESFFEKLEQGAKGDRDYCTNVLRALEVAQETRRLRRNSPSRAATFDWVNGLESLGHEWVLL